MEFAQEERVTSLILKFLTNTRKTAKPKQTKGYLSGRRTLLEDYWVRYLKARDEILALEVTQEIEAKVKKCLDENRYTTIESAYCEALGELNDSIDELSETTHDTMAHSMHSHSTAPLATSAQTILPKIEIPKFSGSFQEWLTFKDMFSTCVIEDKSLSNVQRLHYLKSSVRGEAEGLLRNVPVTESNFRTAWDILQQRFDNKRRLVKTYLRDIIKLPTMNYESAVSMRKIMDGTTEAVRALTQLGRPTSEWDDWLVFLVTDKLDAATVKAWEMSLDSPDALPTFDDLTKFLRNRIQGLDTIVATVKPKPKEYNSQPPTAQPIRSHYTNVSRCPSCTGKHMLMFCPEFKKQTPQQKFDFVTKTKLCFNCLKADHIQSDCSSTYTCWKCKEKHHTLLHDNFQPQSSISVNHSRTENTGFNSAQQQHTGVPLVPFNPVMLATAQIGVVSATGHALQLRALLDSGSQASFISEFAVQQLHLRRSHIQVPITGVGGSTVGRSTGLVEITVTSLVKANFQLNCQALVLPRLGSLIPGTRVDPNQFCEFLDLQLADPSFYEPGSIDVILGADLFGSLLCDGIKQSSIGAPVAQNTYLGWIIYGRVPESAALQLPSTFCASAFTEINELVQHMWKFNEHEDVESVTKMTQDELYCEEFFNRTVRRNSTGRFIVQYPFKSDVDITSLANTKADAVKLFMYQQKRLENDANLKALYSDFMTEYLNLGHMQPVCEEFEPEHVCYIPHHGVYKESSSTTKLRTVFNASKKGKTGLSLNDCLHVGPKLQSDLASIILKWRTFRIGFMADIEKCFRQILVSETDADMQRIIWKNDDGAPTTYKLLTVTYGLNCSPYLTIKVLHTLAENEEVEFPEAAKVLKDSFYMDDCLHGSDTIAGAIELQGQLQELLQRGGFILRKWNSNSLEFLENLSLEVVSQPDSCCDLNLDRETKALGIYWFCPSDCIGYKVKVTPVPGPITKRQQLSDVAKIYDPPCLLAPVVITGKIIFQQLWLSGGDWDDPIVEPYQSSWIKFREELKLIEQLKIPRWVSSSPDDKNVQLHVFSDASTSAYAAVAYLRVETSQGEVKVSILMAKTKVAPLKKISVPCLELNGAHLAANVAAKVINTLQRPDLQIYCWCDSKTTLSWIRSSPGQHKQYVANRVTSIHQLTSIDSWRYVPTKTNPADVASRGVYPSQLAALDIWWRGPTWLHQNEEFWPLQTTTSPDAVAEVATFVATTPTTTTTCELTLTLLQKYSNINTLLSVTSWCRRFIAVKLNQPHETTPWCTANERSAALQFWIRYVQRISFTNEISCLLQNKPINSKSKLLKLNPMIDDVGILRLNGRLKNAIMPEAERFPIILPKESPLCSLLIDQAHLCTLHGGTQATLNYLRRRYWIVDARTSIRKSINRCLKCFRQIGAGSQQIMGALPAHRCTAAPPFQHCGLDYGGPFKTRTTKGRGHHSHKGYVALFVCLSTRAIHLELVSDLTTETFLAALRRFFSQRGYSHDIYSDCATTFVGADAVLTKEFAAYRAQLEAGARFVACRGISWHFIPPGSPNFGGIWEAGIKSMKHHLKRTIGDATLTFEEFYTVLKQIEAVLNSRPLSALSDDHTDLAALTPGHFLVGGPLTAAPELTVLHIETNRLTKWKQIQQMQQDFWKRWSCEYLHELQVRSKWKQTRENLKAGNLVLIRDERAPPSQWALGRVLEVHVGDDGMVRVATVRTQSSVLKRAISKLVMLPIDDGGDASHGGRNSEKTLVSLQDHNLNEVGGNVQSTITPPPTV